MIMAGPCTCNAPSTICRTNAAQEDEWRGKKLVVRIRTAIGLVSLGAWDGYEGVDKVYDHAIGFGVCKQNAGYGQLRTTVMTRSIG